MGLTVLERFGARIWRHIRPLQQRIGPPDRFGKLYTAGLVWGWLPCGLVYAALAGALAAGGVAEGALFMLCFGLGTLPSMLLAGVFAESFGAFVRRRGVRLTAGALMMAFGVWTAGAAIAMHSMGHDHAPRAAPGAPDHEPHHHGADVPPA
jgi:hypothetical protein